jgi:hypothetical protein
MPGQIGRDAGAVFDLRYDGLPIDAGSHKSVKKEKRGTLSLF